MTQLVRYDAMRTAVAAVHRLDEAKDIADKALALRAYARQAKDPEMERWVAEIQLRARRRIGELSDALDKAPSGRAAVSLPDTGKSKSVALAQAGLSKSEAHRCEQIAKIPEAAFEHYIASKAAASVTVTADEAVRMVAKGQRKAATVDAIQAAHGCTVADLATLAQRGDAFGTVYADPPWLYGNQATRASTGNHYDGMSVDEICALPVAQLAAPVCHLHLWTTNGFLFDAKRVLEAWGFEYKSCFVWVKPQMGIGNYWRVSHEFMLLGVKGKQTFADHALKSWGEFNRGDHSAKPERVRQMIERASPGPRLELFGRNAVDGWTVWGNQIASTLFHQAAA